MDADRAQDLPVSERSVGTTVSLRPYQQRDLDFLLSQPRALIWDEAGLGKTRPLLVAAAQAGDGRTLVIAPGGVRDTEVWPLEAERVGSPAPDVISYHQAAKLDVGAAAAKYDTVICDEHHRCKDRKVSWGPTIYQLSQRVERFYGATGTPMPNNAHELWPQLRMVRPPSREMTYYWPWVREWFDPAPTRFDSYAMSGSLIGCHCREPDDLDSAPCEHWLAFHEANIAGYAVRHLRDEVMPDLPPLSGADDPLWCPMTPKQRRLYRQLVKDFLAMIPEDGIAWEALNDSHQFVGLCMLAAGLSVLDPAADPIDRESGKLGYLTEILASRGRPTLVTAWYGNSARAIARVCERLKLSHVILGGRQSRKSRLEAVQRFRSGTVDVLIGSISVIKEGIDGLQYASDEVVLFERSFVPGDNEQTIRRIHRLGQERPVTARQLVTPKTVDAGQWLYTKAKARDISRVLSSVELATLLATT